MTTEMAKLAAKITDGITNGFQYGWELRLELYSSYDKPCIDVQVFESYGNDKLIKIIKTCYLLDNPKDCVGIDIKLYNLNGEEISSFFPRTAEEAYGIMETHIAQIVIELQKKNGYNTF